MNITQLELEKKILEQIKASLPSTDNRGKEVLEFKINILKKKLFANIIC